MNIIQAIQICNDIENLRHFKKIRRFRPDLKEVERIYHHLPLYQYTSYSIDILNDKSKIEASRREKQLSPDEFVPCNFWTFITGTEGNFKTLPLTFNVEITNNGLLPHAPKGENITCSGVAARIIYNKIRKEFYLAKKQKQLQTR